MHLNKELEINDTPYGLRVMFTGHPTNKSVGSCPQEISPSDLNKHVAIRESIWIGGSPDWTTLQIHLGKDRVQYPVIFPNDMSHFPNLAFIKKNLR